ncbi:MAG TPA: DinB family protein [Longimicrobiaceae bacterium]|jgi:uncharacterized damage-inducible protein DinB|nr:DinB family protein [Longimicrobiaceae bacterium]
MSPADYLRYQAGATRQVVNLNIAGITDEESLVQPEPAGNCINFVLGHLLNVYGQAMGLLGASPVLSPEKLKRYERGAPPITGEADALAFAELAAAWDETCGRVDAALAALPAERLAEKAPRSPTGNPDETVGTLLFTVLFHQAYHAGQLGILRRIAGKPGAIA